MNKAFKSGAMKNNNLKFRCNSKQQQGGFGLTEAMIALTAGTVIIGTSAIALRSTGSLIDQSSSKTVLRQNTTNGMRLLRSEVERSLHLIINTGSDKIPDNPAFDLNSPRYKNIVEHCKAHIPGEVFLPIFGIKMASTELVEPVLYGYGISPNSNTYSLMRCGAPMNKIGAYIENTEEDRKEFASVIIDNIGIKNCAIDENGKFLEEICNIENKEEQDAKDDFDKKALSDILEDMQADSIEEKGLLFSEYKGGIATPSVSYRQPALRIQTDTTLKLIKFINPNSQDESSNYSYLQISRNGLSATTSPLFLAAFARADKRLGKYGSEEGLQNITIFKDITSKNVRFVVDGSGSMSACIIWSEETGSQEREFWQPGTGYIWTDQICLLTRMETLIQELHTMVSSLPVDTNLALEMFSAEGFKNHDNLWNDSKNGLIRIGNDGVLDSALNWIVSLDDITNVEEWGGTQPWPALNRAISDQQADTIYLLSDGQPNNFSDKTLPSDVASSDDIVRYYTLQNTQRGTNGDPKMQIHTIALGMKSEWMEQLSEANQGDYMQYDSSALTEVK